MKRGVRWRKRPSSSSKKSPRWRSGRSCTRPSPRTRCIPKCTASGLKWLESCTERGLRVYGQGATRRGGFEMTFVDWNLFDDTEAWREVTLGTRDERKAKMQDPEMRRRLKEEWDCGIRPTTVVAGSVGSLIVQTRNVKIDIGAESAFSDPARAGRGRRRILLPDQDPRRLQAVVNGVPAPGRHGRGRRRTIRLPQPRLPVRQGRREVPHR